MYVKAFIVNVNKCRRPFFLEQHINIVNRVTLRSFWFICNIAIIFLSISLNMCFRSSIDPSRRDGSEPSHPSHRDGSFEYSQYMFWLKNKKNTFQLRILIWGPGITTGLNNFEKAG